MLNHILAVTGIDREARAAAQCEKVLSLAGGGNSIRLEDSLRRIMQGNTISGLVSFGLAGALDPDLKVGDWVVGTHLTGSFEADCNSEWQASLEKAFPNLKKGIFYSDGSLVSDIGQKKQIQEKEKAIAVDMESHIVARIAEEYHCPFIILRVISDQADHMLPPAFSVAMQPDGSIAIPALLKSLLCRPSQLPAFVTTARAATKALKELGRVAFIFGGSLGFPDFS
ncbi:MAG: phosphorylase [Zymomonas mobilis]|uniref:Hopanoid-associated phosphorylase n=1 Tax=Zymomonas mobilis TaxID=542 RepID=A0A542W143_ZYMMB|nr:phosphorylase [Zymomonas mobilis]TQL17294.1 hopanoid-associated phosphorylase [Zymomonas mobilis]